MYLKKVTFGNPLIYLGMHDLVEKHDAITTDDELAAFYHRLLNIAELRNSDLFTGMVYAMITFSTGKNINPQMLIL